MTEHLSEAHIGHEVDAWCNACQRFTRHRVDRVAIGSHAGKPGPCLEHGPKGLSPAGRTKAQEKRAGEKKRDDENPRLF